MNPYRTLSRSKSVRRFYRALMGISIPMPAILAKPLWTIVFLLRQIWNHLIRVFFCEPVFKGACRSYGKNFHTGSFLHWVQGDGDLIFGDNVTVDGKCSFIFASRYTDRPALVVGDNSGIGHNCSFVVGKRITIGEHVRIGAYVTFFDSPGHPLHAENRKAGAPANSDDVRPIHIADNVWIGTSAVIFPGVSIGENSVVAYGAVVMNDVPADSVVAGNPARKIAAVPHSAASA
jgi:acetyltransferase-like isoleucine patch superfamily enzyme